MYVVSIILKKDGYLNKECNEKEFGIMGWDEEKSRYTPFFGPINSADFFETAIDAKNWYLTYEEELHKNIEESLDEYDWDTLCVEEIILYEALSI